MSENEDCCTCIDTLDAFWEKYKYKISSPLAVGLSICGALCGLLVSYNIVIGGVAVAVTNCSVFFTSILLSKFSSENKYLNNDNVSLKNENRRLTIFHNNLTNTINETPQSQDSNLSIEPVVFSQMHKNNRIATFAFPEE